MPSRSVCLFIRSLNCNHRDKKEKADNNNEVTLRESRVWGQVLNLFCTSVLELCSTEVESFVLIESSYSVDFALQFGKAWNRIFVGRDLCNTFVPIRDSNLCCEEESSTDQSELSFKPTV